MDGDSGTDDSGQEVEADFYNLALRLLSGSGWSAAEALLVGQIPQQWPTEIPVTEDYLVIGSLVMSTSYTGANAGGDAHEGRAYPEMTVLLGTNLQPADALERYDVFLSRAGWLRIPIQQNYGGFADSFTERDLLRYINGDLSDGPVLNVIARATPGTDSPSPTELRLHLAKDNSHKRYPHSLERDRGSLYTSTTLIPALKPPRNAQQWSRISTRGEVSWTASTGMLTELDSRGLIEHYSEQLETAGWALSSQGESGPVTWRTWDVKDPRGENWAGALLILERKRKHPAGSRRYLVTISVDQVM